MSDLLSFDNPVFRQYAMYSGVSIIKMFCLGPMTSVRRLKRKAYANPEDGDGTSRYVNTNDPVVERARRNHLNDLENIPAFILTGAFYVLTDPNPTVAAWHFRVFAASRILHMLAYQSGLQPWRGLMYIIGIGTTISMWVSIFRKAAF